MEAYPAGPKLLQRAGIPTLLTPNTPQKLLHLLGKGTLKEKMRIKLHTITAQDAYQGPLEAPLAQIT